jgi:glutaconyl-CoA/methylmalonyl-CoA decarboxylase subunit gamma
LIMEAMKMENEIKSDRGGVISALKVNLSDSVLEGDILVEIGS